MCVSKLDHIMLHDNTNGFGKGGSRDATEYFLSLVDVGGNFSEYFCSFDITVYWGCIGFEELAVQC